MEKIKIGDIVARKSYNKDILFRVKNIVDTKKGQKGRGGPGGQGSKAR